MSIKNFITTSNEEATFEINNIDLSIVNGIRRIMLSEVPKIIIDFKNVNIIQNTSVLHDNIWKQRLGFIQIDQQEINKFNIDDLEFKLNTINDEYFIADVLLSHFEIFSKGQKIKKNIFLYPDTLIGKLKISQKINITGKFTQNTAKNGGASYSHSAGIGYHFKRDDKKINKIIKEKNIPKDKIDIFLNSEGDRLYLKDDKQNPQVVMFNMETNGSYPAKILLKKSIDVLKNKLTHCQKKYHIEKAKTKFLAYNLIYQNEDDTFGNIIQTQLLKNKKVSYCGYQVPHPLDNILIVRVSVGDKFNEKDVIEVYDNAIDELHKICDKLLDF